jgi:hypothetical protein
MHHRQRAPSQEAHNSHASFSSSGAFATSSIQSLQLFSFFLSVSAKHFSLTPSCLIILQEMEAEMTVFVKSIPL